MGIREGVKEKERYLLEVCLFLSDQNYCEKWTCVSVGVEVCSILFDSVRESGLGVCLRYDGR